MFSAVLMMAGRGSRMQAEKNKVLLPLANKPIFLYSVETFMKFDCEIILVINPQDVDEVTPYIESYKRVKVVVGGLTRQESVYNGLMAVTNDIVMIHDCARPFISEGVIFKVHQAMTGTNAVFVGNYATDTIRQKIGDNFITLNRDDIVLVGTPQCASLSLLLAVHRKAINEGYRATDDIELVEKFSDSEIDMIEGNIENFKITTPFDLAKAKAVLGEA